MAEKFKVGDTVRLKSGGSIMTVNGVRSGTSGKTIVDTVWFSGSKASHGAFDQDTLDQARVEPKK